MGLELAPSRLPDLGDWCQIGAAAAPAGRVRVRACASGLREGEWQLPRSKLPSGRTLLMGVVNVTPDSFSDGGKFLAADAAVEHGLRLAAEGADLLDVGGESTNPFGARPVDAAEE